MLSKYILHYGDCVFAIKWTGSFSTEAQINQDKKKKCIECIQAEMKHPSSGQAKTSSSYHIRPGLGLGNKNAARKTRKIELGWMNFIQLVGAQESLKKEKEDFDFTLCVMGAEEPLDGTFTVGALCNTTHYKDKLMIQTSSAQAKSPDSRGSHLTRSLSQIFLSYRVTSTLLELSVSSVLGQAFY